MKCQSCSFLSVLYWMSDLGQWRRKRSKSEGMWFHSVPSFSKSGRTVLLKAASLVGKFYCSISSEKVRTWADEYWKNKGSILAHSLLLWQNTNRKQHGEERLYFSLQPIMKGNGSRTWGTHLLSGPKAETMEECCYLTCSLACSTCFLKQPRATCPGGDTAPSGLNYPHQVLIKKLPTDLPTGQHLEAIPQLTFPFPRWA